LASAVIKTFHCIEALARSPQGLTVSEVAVITGFSRPAATRLLERLTTDSITVRDASKRYHLGLRLYEWATTAVQASTPVNIARKEFIRLSQDLGRECNFIVLEGLDAILLERCEDIDGVIVNRPLPGRRVWFKTATGKALLAYSAPAAAKAVIEETVRRTKATDLPANFAAEIGGELEEVRTRGFAVTTGVRPEGFLSIGMPILGHSGHPVAAIGTYMGVSELDTDAGMGVISQMKATCARISHYLGFEAEITPLVS
jgi:IclR family transcriptional regulator, acetate operon repressor